MFTWKFLESSDSGQKVGRTNIHESKPFVDTHRDPMDVCDWVIMLKVGLEIPWCLERNSKGIFSHHYFFFM